MPSVKRVDCHHLKTLRRDDLPHVVLDVRDVLEFESGHIAKSVNCPRRELQTNLENLIPDKAKRVVVIAGPTEEAEIEAIREELEGLGYKNAEFLAGGFDAWCEIAPLEVEPDLTEMTPEEEGAVGDKITDIDPEEKESEPIY